MSVPQVKIKNTSDVWNPKFRYKVNDTVEHQQNIYQNITGFNDTPTSLSANWLLISPAVTPTVTVNGNIFGLIKQPQNNTPGQEFTLEVNDMIVSGWWDNTTFWPMAMYLGGDVDLIASWNQINPIEDLVII